MAWSRSGGAADSAKTALKSEKEEGWVADEWAPPKGF
jgi:hypothetical protein